MAQLTVRPSCGVEFTSVAAFMPGQSRCGDLHAAVYGEGFALFAVVDGIGHGEPAAVAAESARRTIVAHPREALEDLLTLCHDALRPTRGAVMSIARIDLDHRELCWLGVGNVRGALCRAIAPGHRSPEELLLRPGVVGARLPRMRSAALPIHQGDTLILSTDGVRGDIADHAFARGPIDAIARDILERGRTGRDDALVLVARLR